MFMRVSPLWGVLYPERLRSGGLTLFHAAWATLDAFGHDAKRLG